MNSQAPQRQFGGRIRVSADLIVVVVLLAGLIGFSAYTATRRPQEQPVVTASTHSTRPNGAAALYRWLADLGYRVERLESETFDVSDEAELVFVLAPPIEFSSMDRFVLSRWASGADHTLVVAVDGFLGAELAKELGADIESSPDQAGVLTPTVPLLISPPPGPVQVGTANSLRPDRNSYVAHLQAGDRPVLVSWHEGQGRTILTTTIAPFTNQGLRDPGSARLVYNLVAGLKPGALIQFDEVHHGLSGEQGNAFTSWVHRSPWGWAILFAGAATAAWMVLRGRQFGRPVPLAETTARRAEGEYVVSMAGLLRRAGRRAFVMHHLRDRLKRELARPWRLNPGLPDEEFVGVLAGVRNQASLGLSEERVAALRVLLVRLAAGKASEADLVRLAAEVDTWTRETYVH